MAYCIENFFEDMSTKDSKTKFILPAIQRGFVWKAYQIENFWDSLARSFPIGSFIVKENIHNDNHEVHILDGQQRASAILIGMTGAKDDSPFNIANNRMRLFIDLEKPCLACEASNEENSEENENESEEIASTEETIIEKRFVFRCITRSHPWGYQKNKNAKRLETKDIRNALEYFENKYIEGEKIIKDNTHYYAVDDNAFLNFFPYDCMVPLPVDIVFSAKDKNNFIDNAQKYLRKFYNDFISIDSAGNIKINTISKEIDLEDMDIPTKGLRVYLKSLFSDKKNKEEVKDLKFFNLGTIYDKLVAIKKYGLTFCTLDNNPIKFDKQENSNAICQQNKIDDADIETVFYRINMGGTRLTEDDLNYSLFKSCMKDTNLIKNFENACVEILEPAKAFKLAYLLYKQVNNNCELAYSTVKYEEIKRAINNGVDKKQKTFLDFLEKDFLNKNILENYKKFLVYSEDNENGLPMPLFVKINSAAPELVFLLIYRLCFCGDIDNKEYQDRIIGLFLCLYFYYKGKRQRNYKELLNYIWPLVEENFSCDIFWSKHLLCRANLIYDEDINIKISDDFISNSANFTDKWLKKYFFYNNELILYAQRKTLNKWFKNDNYFLEDSFIPYDFDHICPKSVKKKRFNKFLKENDLLNIIGNMRAWPFELNRHDQDEQMYKKIENPELGDKEKIIRKKYKLDDNIQINKYFREWTFLQRNFWIKELINVNVNTLKSTSGSSSTKSYFEIFVTKRTQAIHNEIYKLISGIKIICPFEDDIDVISEKLEKKFPDYNFSYYEEDWLSTMNKNIILEYNNGNETSYEYFTLISPTKEMVDHLCIKIGEFINNINSTSK